jgi:hypothetical protein
VLLVEKRKALSYPWWLLKPNRGKDSAMAMDVIIIHLYCIVADRLYDVKPHRNAKLHPSEVVTIGLLYALKGHGYRAFYRWLDHNWKAFFPALPDKTRLHRLLATYQHLTDAFLAEPTFFTVIDSFGIELLHPMREGRSVTQLGKKGTSNHRWMIGIKFCPMLNHHGAVVNWSWAPANTHDQHFRTVATLYDQETITLADSGFAQKGVPQQNIKLCKRGTWNERMKIETTYSLLTVLFHAKHMRQRVHQHLEGHLAYLAALINVLLHIIQETGVSWKDFTL